MKKSFPKNAFTLAETIMTLFIVGLVVTAAIPAFTVKQKNTNPAEEAKSNTAKVPWAYCDESQALGLCGIYSAADTYNTGGSRLLVGSTDAAMLEMIDSGTAYDVTIVNSNANDNVFDLFQADERNFQVGKYHFREHGTNLYITQDKSVAQSAAAASNVIIGKNIVNDIEKTNTMSHNVIIGTNGTDGNEIGNNISYNTIIGQGNYSTSNYNTFFGRGNHSASTKDVLIGNNNSGNGDSLRIGSNVSRHKFNIGNIMYADISGVPAELGPLTFAHDVTLTGALKTNAVIAASDIRLKNIKGAYTKGLNEILQVNPVNFKYKNSDKLQTGVIAQDVQKIFPEAVVTMPNGYLGVNNDPIFFAMLNAMKEVNAKAESEEQRQIRLQKELNELKAEIETLDSCDARGILGRIKCFFVKIKRHIIAQLRHCERSEAIHFKIGKLKIESGNDMSLRTEAECRRGNLFHARTAPDIKWIASLLTVVRNDLENKIPRGEA